MLIEEVRTTADFANLRSEWSELLDASASRCIFLTHEWLFAWWQHLAEGRQLSIVTARENGTLLGILPLVMRRAEVLRMTPRLFEFLGSGVIGSDYLDVILRSGAEERVLEAFADWLSHTGMMVRFTQLRRGSSVSERLAGILSHRKWVTAAAKTNVCPFIDLQGQTWETYLASLGSSQRQNFQRRLKNLSRTSSFRLEHCATPKEAARGLDALIRLHSDRWKARGGKSDAFQTTSINAFHHAFIQAALERGWLRLMMIWMDQRPAAGLYGLQYDGTFSFYQSGFDPEFAKHSVGLVMMGLAIKTALDGGCAEYDLLHGDEEYKFHWAHRTRELGRLELFPARVRARFYQRAIGFNRAARRMASHVLNRM